MTQYYLQPIDGLCYCEDVMNEENIKKTRIIFDNKCNPITNANQYIKHLRTFETGSYNTLKRVAGDLCFLYNFLSIAGLSINEIDVNVLAGFVYYLAIYRVKPIDGERKLRYAIENALVSKPRVLKNKNEKIVYINRAMSMNEKSIGRIFERAILYLGYLFREGIFRNQGLIKQLSVRRNAIGYLRAQGIEVERHESIAINRDQLVTVEEIDNIRKNATAPYELLLYFILEKTGFRIGEGLGLKIAMSKTPSVKDIKGDISFTGERWRIEVVWRPENDSFCRTKGHRNRDIELTKEESYIFELLLERYLKWRERYCEDMELNWLFINRNGKQLTYDTTYKQFRRTLYKSGISRKVKLHFYRHTWATNQILSGVPIEFVSKALGHKDKDTTEEMYFHLTGRSLVQIRERLDKKL